MGAYFLHGHIYTLFNRLIHACDREKNKNKQDAQFLQIIYGLMVPWIFDHRGFQHSRSTFFLGQGFSNQFLNSECLICVAF